MNELSKKLKALREKHLISRKEFASLLNCPLSRIVNVEKGVAELKKAQKSILVKKFNLPADFFDAADIAAPLASGQDGIIGFNMKRLRADLNLTQQELAEELGYSSGAVISAIETGKRPIGKKKLVEVAHFFNIHVAELFREPAESFSQEAKTQKILEDFYRILNANPKPAVFSLISKLIKEGCLEIDSRY